MKQAGTFIAPHARDGRCSADLTSHPCNGLVVIMEAETRDVCHGLRTKILNWKIKRNGHPPRTSTVALKTTWHCPHTHYSPPAAPLWLLSQCARWQRPGDRRLGLDKSQAPFESTLIPKETHLKFPYLFLRCANSCSGSWSDVSVNNSSLWGGLGCSRNAKYQWSPLNSLRDFSSDSFSTSFWLWNNRSCF